MIYGDQRQPYLVSKTHPNIYLEGYWHFFYIEKKKYFRNNNNSIIIHSNIKVSSKLIAHTLCQLSYTHLCQVLTIIYFNNFTL